MNKDKYTRWLESAKAKIGMMIGLSLVFYYGVVFNPIFLVNFMKGALYVGGVIALKELVVLIVIQKTNPWKIAKDLGIGLLAYLLYVILLFLYFAGIIYLLVN